ncbi:DUF4199 domain-containing protein [Nafulsella turpanensis]|uniref:DUF4199 domain-containing protein n=1 Tax=Nafulsella turpanensis TaxID=1265690 RepID=UPI00034D2938|nr:DUF4199 domain-containing protein [Nafulsella turpanensis]
MFKIALKYGVLIVLFTFIWICLEYWAGLHADYIDYHPLATLLSLVVPLLLLYYAMREAKREDDGEFTYGDAFKTGVFVTLVVALLNPLGQWLFQQMVFPGYLEAMQAHAEAKQLAQGIDVEVAQQVAAEEYALDSFLLRAVLGSLTAGLVMSAILAIFVRDKALPKGS